MSKLWSSFDKLFDHMGDMFDDMGEMFDNMGEEFEEKHDKATKHKWWSGNSVNQSTVINNGKKVVITNRNGKQTITVDGKEYVQKGEK